MNDPGQDGIWFTDDDVVYAIRIHEWDETGGCTKRAYYNNPGPDGIWGTEDDIHGLDYYGAYFTAENEGNYNKWWSWIRYIAYDDAGPDGIWFNEDDTVRDFRVHEFDDEIKFFTKEIIYNDTGPDGVMFTADDVISGYITGQNNF